MNTTRNLALGVAVGVMLAAAAAMLVPGRSGSTSGPVWTPVDSDREPQTFTQEQLLKGSGLLWQIYGQGYRDGQAHAPAPGKTSSAILRK
jgi:hypothetical protein